MDTWLDQVGLRMRNVINKADDSGALELVDGQDVREHWDAFFRIRFRKLYFENTQIIIFIKWKGALTNYLPSQVTFCHHTSSNDR